MAFENPLSWKEVWTTSKQIYLPRWKDKDDDVIKLKNDLAPIKPFYHPESIVLYHCAMNKPVGAVDSYIETYMNKVNSGSWRIAEAGQAWVQSISHSEMSVNDVDVARVIVVVAVTDLDDGWKMLIPEISYMYDDEGFKAFKDDEGYRYIGNLKNDGDDGGSTMLVTAHEVKKEVSFSGIGF